MKIKRFSSRAKVPLRADSAGYNIFSAEKKSRKRIYGGIAGCSGMALKYSINIESGVTGSDFRGKVFIILFNHSSTALL